MSALVTLVAADDIGSRDTVQLALMLVSGAFIAIAVYVGAIVTANTFATIIAGRTHTIALMRLIGSSAVTQRRAVARQGLLVGLSGSLLGGAFGLLMATVALRWGSHPAVSRTSAIRPSSRLSCFRSASSFSPPWQPRGWAHERCSQSPRCRQPELRLRPRSEE